MTALEALAYGNPEKIYTYNIDIVYNAKRTLKTNFKYKQTSAHRLYTNVLNVGTRAWLSTIVLHSFLLFVYLHI